MIYLSCNGEVVGRCVENVLLKLYTAGHVNENFYYWREGMKQWRPLNELVAPEVVQNAKRSVEVNGGPSTPLPIQTEQGGFGPIFASIRQRGALFLGLVVILSGVSWLLLAGADHVFDLSEGRTEALGMREIEVTGRVSVRSWSGALTVPPGAKVVVVPAAKMERELRRRLASVDGARVEAEKELDRARVRWREKAAARDEASRVSAVAERANTPDVETCRQRLIAAEAALSDAFIDLEEVSARVEHLTDPIAVVAGLTDMSDAIPIASEGLFVLRVNAEVRPLVLVKAEPSLVWLEPVEISEGQSTMLELSNANVLDLATLRARVGGLAD